jgi:hypothetical protein
MLERHAQALDAERCLVDHGTWAEKAPIERGALQALEVDEVWPVRVSNLGKVYAAPAIRIEVQQRRASQEPAHRPLCR